MVDVVDRATRSRMMAGIRGRDTKPELVLRRLLHGAGLRYRLHARDLPGRPDIAFPSRRAAIFVHGCFWHRHEGCHWCSSPASNSDFWSAKFARNVERDAEVQAAFHLLGWRTAKVWECALRGQQIEATAAGIVDWVRNGVGDLDTGIVRVRRNTSVDGQT